MVEVSAWSGGFVEGLIRTPAQAALDVVKTVLPRAPGRSAGPVRTDIAAALIALDPAGATDRARTARTGRKVNRPQVLPDGMASRCADMPAVDATALDLALGVAARTARTSGDARTLDQLRANALATLAHTALATGHIGPPPHTGADGDGGWRRGVRRCGRGGIPRTRPAPRHRCGRPCRDRVRWTGDTAVHRTQDVRSSGQGRATKRSAAGRPGSGMPEGT